MTGLLAIGLLFAVPLIFIIGSDDDTEEEEPEPLGTDGNDLIQNGDGTQGLVYELGDGNDRVFAGSGDDTISSQSGDTFIDPGAGDDLIQGGAGDLSILDNEGDDTILGGSGNDWIRDTTGANVVDGGVGNDRLGANTGSTVTGGAGIDRFDMDLHVNAADPLVITDFVPGEDFFSDLAVYVSGNQSGEVSFEDRSDGMGADVLFDGNVIAEIMGATVDDLTPLPVRFVLEESADFASQGSQGDDIIASYFADTIDGGEGNDFITARGNVDGTGDLLMGGDGDDRISARGISDRGLPDPIDGEGFFFVTEQSTLDGGAGDDRLYSRDSNVLTGGDGNDIFELRFTDGDNLSAAVPVVITDFVQGADQIAIYTGNFPDDAYLSIVPWPDDSGSDILAGGTVLAQVAGGQNLTLSDLVIADR